MPVRYVEEEPQTGRFRPITDREAAYGDLEKRKQAALKRHSEAPKAPTEIYKQGLRAFLDDDLDEARRVLAKADPKDLASINLRNGIERGVRPPPARFRSEEAPAPSTPILPTLEDVRTAASVLGDTTTELLLTRPAEGAEVLRGAAVDLMAPSEAALEEEAARTGRTPYLKIAGRTAAELGTEFVPLTPTEIALYSAIGPSMRGIGKGAMALESRLGARNLISRGLKLLRTPVRFPWSKPTPAPVAADEATEAILGTSAGPDVSEAASVSGRGRFADIVRQAEEDQVLGTMLGSEAAPAAGAAPAAVAKPAIGGKLPPASPVFDTAAQREQLIRQAMLKREAGRVETRLEVVRRKADRIKAIREGKAGDLPATKEAAAEEMRLVESDAVAEIERTAKAMKQRSREVAGGPTTLEEFVLERGGLRSYKPDLKTGRPIEREEWKDLPKAFRAEKGKGVAPDVAAQDAYEAGLLSQPNDQELIRYLRSLPQTGKVEPWRAFIPDAERMAENPESNLFLARRYLELRKMTGGQQLPGMTMGGRKPGMTEDKMRRQIETLGRQWEVRRARMAGQSVRTGKAGPDIIGAGEEGDILAPEMAGNIRVSKFPGEDIRFKIRQAADELGWAAGEPHGGRRTFQETGKMAEQLLGKGVRGEDLLKVPAGTALNDSEMRVAQVLTDDAFRQAQKAEDMARAAAGRLESVDLERKAAEAWDNAKALLDRLSEFKTTSGRAVGIQKAISPDDIDLPTEYLKKTAESDVARRLVGPERTAYLREKYEEFVRLPREAQQLLFEKEQNLSSFEEFRRNWIKPTLNIWRASLVSQLMTAMRNFSSQAMAGLWNVLDDTVAAAGGTVVRVARGEAPREAWRKASAGLLEDFIAVARRFRPEDRKALDELLTSHFPKAREQLLGRSAFLEPEPYGTTMAARKYGRFTRAYGDLMTWLSRWGEKQQRLYFFEAGLRERIRRHYPEVLKTMDFRKVPFDQFRDIAQFAADAADQAMRLTFAQEFKEGIAGGFLKVMRMPVIEEIGALGGATFPRFMSNAYSWLWRHGPGIGLLETMLSPAGRRGLMTGSPEAMKAVAGAVTGTMAFSAAIYARSHPEFSEGARWYEVRLPGKEADGKPRFINTLAYNPLLAPYLFMGELAVNGTQKMQRGDFKQGILMLRLAGLGRFTTDLLSGALTQESAGKILKSTTGEFLGGFATPLNTLKDAIAGWSAEERKFRDTRQAPLVGPFMARLPLVSRLLPEAVSPTRSGARESETPWMRQLTGFYKTKKNALEERLAEINYDMRSLYPRLGDPRANWLVTGELGKIAEEIAPALLRRLDGEAADMRREGRGQAEINEVQRIRVSQAYSHWKKMAMNRARAKDPGLFQQIKTEGARGRKRVILIRSGNGG